MRQLSATWIKSGLPAAEALEKTARQLDSQKRMDGINTIWDRPVLMVTATLDDGLGQGLLAIHRFAGVIGLSIHHLGFLLPPETIIAACRRLNPLFVGLTVLQTDSEDDLAQVGRSLPGGTRLIAGGPAFRCDPEMASRCGVHFVAADVAHFIDFICQVRFEQH